MTFIRAIALCVISLIPASVAASAQNADTGGWSITYADGRVVTHVLKSKGGLWTPLFPKLEEVTIAPSGSAKYLDVQYITEGADLVATVSLRTVGFRDRVRVAVVRVRRHEPVAVEQLRKYGVAPVTLTLVSIGPVQAYPPVVSEPSGQLLVEVMPTGPNVPIYRFEVTNQGARAVRAFDFEAYQDDRRILSGRRKTERNEALVLAGQKFTFEVTLGNRDGESWRTLDRVVLTSVMWEDGVVDGDQRPATSERVLARNRVFQLQTLLKSVRNATSLAALWAAFSALDRSDVGLEKARASALVDLDKLQSASADAVNTWVTSRIAEYSSWLERCEQAAQN